MEKEYRELKELTTSIVNIYLELAKLEKQGKRESQEYENLVLILPKALELEKRKSFILSEKDDCIATNKEIIKNATWKDNIILQPTKEVLVAIRLLNLMDKEMYYSLLGSTSKTVQIHYYMEESFLYELVKHIYRVSASEKEILFDFIYAILASSTNYDLAYLNPTKPTFSLNQEDQVAIQVDLLPKCLKVNDKLFSLTDADLTRGTILLVLYVKTVLHFHPYEKNAIEENTRAVQLLEWLEVASGKKCSEVRRLLSLLNEKEKINSPSKL